ncbi:MAG: endonuclease/exonuclease/phosphatase family protein, partial [Ardenticatenales bacterium]|nr:endonuclease/exonuclease/phosphatase family protein [Ardenticatenales bacterium]
MTRVRVMTYNILHGGRGREAVLSEVIQHAQPDILLLQEVAGPDLVALLARSLGLSHFFLAASNRPRHNLALLSHYPIRYSNSFRPRPVWR